MKSVLPAESSRGPTPGSDGRDRIPTPVSHRDLSDDSSDSDEVASQRDRFGEVREASVHVTYGYTGHRICHWSPSRELFGITHPEEPSFNTEFL
jgi:hypothetical protein